MSTGPQKQVHPAASALLILLVLGGIQAVWWRFLVYHPPGKAGPPPAGGGGGGAREVLVLGRTDVKVSTYSGGDEPGNADGPGHAARFDRPTGLALDTHGNLFVADTGNNRVRRIAASGETATIAGGEAGYADGPALQARFNAPCGVCVGPDESLYVADTGNRCVRRIQNGIVTTVIGGSGRDVGNTIRAGSPVGLVTGVAYVQGAQPVLLVADASGRKVHRVRMDGTVANDLAVPGCPVAVIGSPEAAAIPDTGTLVCGSRQLTNVPVDAPEPVTAAQLQKLSLRSPVGICRLGATWLLTDKNHGAIFLLANAKAQVVAGFCTSAGAIRGSRDGDGSTSMFGAPCGIVTDGKRYAYVADTANNDIRRLDISALTGQQ